MVYAKTSLGYIYPTFEESSITSYFTTQTPNNWVTMLKDIQTAELWNLVEFLCI